MTPPSRLKFAHLAFPLTLAFSSCGDGLDLTPNLSAPGTPVTTPTPVPTATPTPTPTPTPNALTCQLPSQPDCGNSGCCEEGGTPLFNSEISSAQAELQRTRPDLFNSNGSLRSTDEIAYTDLLAKQITAMFGLCAVGGGTNGESRSKDEVGIKANNNVSQNIDVIIGSSNSPYVGGRYTCRPASF